MQGSVSEDIQNAKNAAAEIANFLIRIEAELSRLSSLVDYHDTNKGKRFEQMFAEMARCRGLVVRPREDSKHDWIVNNKRVQCKRIDKASCAICTTPIIGRDYCGYQKDDWDVLAIQQKGIVLLIPIEFLLKEDGVRVRSTVKCKDWMCWEDRWDVFEEGFLVQREVQGKLF
jgi:hypothetical protein